MFASVAKTTSPPIERRSCPLLTADLFCGTHCTSQSSKGLGLKSAALSKDFLLPILKINHQIISELPPFMTSQTRDLKSSLHVKPQLRLVINHVETGNLRRSRSLVPPVFSMYHCFVFALCQIE